MADPTSHLSVFVTGGTGEIGSKLLPILKKHSVPAKIASRRQKQVNTFHKEGLNAILADLSAPISELTSAIQGCNTLYLLTAATINQRQQAINAIDAALTAGVKWIIKVSAADARDEGDTPWVKDHFAADRHLMRRCDEKGVKWTILAASAFMQNLLVSAPAIQRGFLPQTSRDGKAGWIDTQDVAEVSVQILRDGPEKHGGKNYVLTGPQLLSIPEMAGILSREVGHHVRYSHLPGPVFGLLLRATGADEFTANGLVAQFVEIVRPGLEGIEVSDHVERIIGRPPTSFEVFVREHREDLRGFDAGPWIAGGVGVIASLCVALFWRR